MTLLSLKIFYNLNDVGMSQASERQVAFVHPRFQPAAAAVWIGSDEFDSERLIVLVDCRIDIATASGINSFQKAVTKSGRAIEKTVHLTLLYQEESRNAKAAALHST
jgi:hypothetical protein